jgi:Cu+-exporting ATPase
MSETTQQLTLPITGMTCASCASKVQESLNKVPGVDEAAVNLATERATVRVNGEVNPKALVRAVKDTGYDVGTETIILPIGGMTCASCVSTVEGALSGVPGVMEANVNLATERASVTYIPGVVGLAEFKAAVDKTGYQVLEPESKEDEGEVDQDEIKMRKARFRMQVAWGLTIPIVLWMFLEMFFGIMWPNEIIFNLGMIILAWLCQFYSGWAGQLIAVPGLQ